MTTPRQIAEAFSGHRFGDAYAALSPDVRWTSVGAGVLTGRQAVVDACEATLAELASGTAEFLRFVVIADGDAVAVDAVGGTWTPTERSAWCPPATSTHSTTAS